MKKIDCSQLLVAMILVSAAACGDDAPAQDPGDTGGTTDTTGSTGDGDGDDDDTPTECGPNSLPDGDDCVCDPGFEPDPGDPSRCVEVDEEPEPEGETPLGRLLVSDGAEGRVVILDLESGDVVSAMSVAGSARVYPNSNGGLGFAVQTGAGAVEGIHPGLSFIDHGDHYHVEEKAPEMLSQPSIECSRPIHFVANDGWSAAFCDGDGMVHVFEDDGRAMPTVEVFDSGRAHHGVALSAFDSILVSNPNPDDEMDALPVGVRVIDPTGTTADLDFNDCPKLHGEAFADGNVCFGCGDGVMCLGASEAGPLEMTKLTPPDGTADGVRVGTISASAENGVFIGNWGQDLVRIDLATDALEPIAVGKQVLRFQTGKRGEFVYVLSADGLLSKLSVATGEVVAQETVFDEFTIEPGHGQLRPTFAIAPHYLYVVDPRSTDVVELDLATLAPTKRELTLPAGQYHSVALTALPPPQFIND